MNESIYLDNHSATKPCQSALERMRPYLEEQWGASFSSHRMGFDQIAAIDGRIQSIFELAGAGPEDQFAFASGGAEAVHQVFWSVYLDSLRKKEKGRFVAGCFEDAPAIENLRRLEELGCSAEFVAAGLSGQIDLQQLHQALHPQTTFLSVSWAQGLTGVIQPINQIAEICAEKNVYLHVDATYAVGKIPLEFFCDYLTFSGDRMHGLKSSAALFAKKGRPLFPAAPGAHCIDVPSLVAFSAAAQQSLLTIDSIALETARLRNRFEQSVIEKVKGAKILFSESPRLPNVSVIAFMGVHQEALLYALHRKKVYASIGGSYHQELGRLLTASGYDGRTALSSVSFSLSRMTTEAEIDTAVERIAQAFESMRAISGDLAEC